MTFHRFRIALVVVATACALLPVAGAQTKPAPNCPTAKELKAAQLHGRWSVRFDKPPAGLPATATMVLERHAEFAESLAGVVTRKLAAPQAGPGHAASAALAGDLEEGLLLLDESSDNVSITGAWNGELVAGSCGRVFRGMWKDTSSSAPPDAPDVPFTLTRLP